jgi:hypothetical protein
MNNNVTEQKCDDCGAAVSNYDGVYLSDGDIRSFLCSKCYNESTSKAIGLNFDITNIESTSTRKIYSAFNTYILPERIGDITGFEGLEILKVCMEYIRF